MNTRLGLKCCSLYQREASTRQRAEASQCGILTLQALIGNAIIVSTDRLKTRMSTTLMAFKLRLATQVEAEREGESEKQGRNKDQDEEGKDEAESVDR
jgi:hypothetical protein